MTRLDSRRCGNHGDETLEALANPVSELVLEAVVLAGEDEHLPIELDRPGVVSSRLVKPRAPIQPIDGIGVVALQAIAEGFGLVEVAGVDQVDSPIGELIQLIELGGERGVSAAPRIEASVLEDAARFALGGGARALGGFRIFDEHAAALVLLPAAASARVISSNLCHRRCSDRGDVAYDGGQRHGP